MKSMWLPLAVIFFMTYFHRARGPWPPCPPDPLLRTSILLFRSTSRDRAEGMPKDMQTHCYTVIIFVAILVRMMLSAKIELTQVPILSSRDPNCQNNIQLFLQQSEKFSVYCDTSWHYKVLGMKQTSEWHFTCLDLKMTISHTIAIL